MGAMAERSASYLIGRVNRMTTTELTEALADTNISLMELTALSVLADRPGLSNARLARRSLISPQAMHKVVTALMERGLVERDPGQGGRAIDIVITDAGRALLDEVEPRRRAAEDRLLAALDADERVMLGRLLAKIARLEPALAGEQHKP
jgi:DNA-binding MarR family transcriptional regulator